MRKASVLPLPVLALPRTSRASRAGGMDRDWIAVGDVKWLLLRPIYQRAADRFGRKALGRSFNVDGPLSALLLAR